MRMPRAQRFTNANNEEKDAGVVGNLEDVPPPTAYESKRAEEDETKTGIGDARQDIGRLGHFEGHGLRPREYDD